MSREVKRRKHVKCEMEGTRHWLTGESAEGARNGLASGSPGPQPAHKFASADLSSRSRCHQVAKMQRMRKAAKWTQQDRRWRRVDATQPPPDFSKYNVQVEIPEYDDEIYEEHLRHDDWTKAETDYLVETYRECNGKWPVVWDHYEYEDKTRSMEDLKARFYKVSAQLLQLKTPIQSMGTAEFDLYNTLNTFDPAKEESRKSLAKGHLYRKANEVDEETVLLGELQRIMVNQATLDGQREELRKRLDYPHANTNGYQYSTSQALTQLWQQLLAQDRMKKNPRLKPTGGYIVKNHSFFDHTDMFQGTQTTTASCKAGCKHLNQLDLATAMLVCQKLAEALLATDVVLEANLLVVRPTHPVTPCPCRFLRPTRLAWAWSSFRLSTKLQEASVSLRTDLRNLEWRRAPFRVRRSRRYWGARVCLRSSHYLRQRWWRHSRAL